MKRRDALKGILSIPAIITAAANAKPTPEQIQAMRAARPSFAGLYQQIPNTEAHQEFLEEFMKRARKTGIVMYNPSEMTPDQAMEEFKRTSQLYAPDLLINESTGQPANF